MTSSDPSRSDDSERGRAFGISRATFLRGAAAAVAGGIAFPLLDACSSGGSRSAGAGASAGTGSAAGAPPAAGSGTLSAADIATIKSFLGPIDAKSAGAGETWNIGAIMPFSTSGAVYGQVFSSGVKLAVEHIKALGGPNISIN